MTTKEWAIVWGGIWGLIQIVAYLMFIAVAVKYLLWA